MRVVVDVVVVVERRERGNFLFRRFVRRWRRQKPLRLFEMGDLVAGFSPVLPNAEAKVCFSEKAKVLITPSEFVGGNQDQ